MCLFTSQENYVSNYVPITACHSTLFFSCIIVAPSIAPMDVSIDRTSPTVMVVSWTPLSYVEARGFISHYTVAYSPQTSGGRMRQATGQTVTVPGMDSSTTTIDNLDPDTVYSVQVSATTGGGSEMSVMISVLVPGKEWLLFMYNGLLSSNMHRQEGNFKAIFITVSLPGFIGY